MYSYLHLYLHEQVIQQAFLQLKSYHLHKLPEILFLNQRLFVLAYIPETYLHTKIVLQHHDFARYNFL